MSFHEEIAKIKNGVLIRPEYMGPINEINKRINRENESYRPQEQVVEHDVI